MMIEALIKDDAVREGDQAPDFELQRQDGGLFRLHDLLKEKNVVLYFYPKDNTSRCTKQACQFRDQYERFQEYDAEVVGVSSDSLQSHQKFERIYHLPFTLLSDKDGQIRSIYGVPRRLGLLPGRVTYIIDRNRTVRAICTSMSNPQDHVETALEVLHHISAEQLQRA
ncbi:peroxiredoxin [Pontibacter sp. CAU 1760]